MFKTRGSFVQLALRQIDSAEIGMIGRCSLIEGYRRTDHRDRDLVTPALMFNHPE